MKVIAGRVGDDIILEQLERLEDALLDATNSIDTKASQLFAAAALLAVQPAVLFTQDISSKWIIWVQAAGCLFLFVTFCLAHETLRVRKFDIVNASDEWRDETIAPAAESREEDGPALMVWSLIIGIRKRIVGTQRTNNDRLKWLIFGRYALILALLANFTAIAGLAFKSPSLQGSKAPVSAPDSRCAPAAPDHVSALPAAKAAVVGVSSQPSGNTKSEK